MNELDLPPFLQDRVLPAEEALERTVPSGTRLASGFATSEPHSFYASLWDHVREHDLTGLAITQALFLHPHPLLVGRAMEIRKETEEEIEALGSSVLAKLRRTVEGALGKVEAMNALVEHYEELRARQIRFVSGFMGPATNTILPENLLVRALHGEWAGRNLARSGILSAQGVHFPDAPDAMILGADQVLDIDLFVLVMTPPNEEGLLSHGPANGANAEALEHCLEGDANVLLYLNRRYPFVRGHQESPNTIATERLREAAAEGRLFVVEDDGPIPAIPEGAFDHPSDAERAIAEHVVNHVETHPELTRGRALQVGIGSTGALAVKALRDSSWRGRSYTEMLEPFTWELFQAGKIDGTHFIRSDGTRETLDGKLMATFSLAPKGSDFYDEIDGNDAVLLSAASRVVISEAFYGGLGINNVLAIDFHGHVNVSSRDENPYSGVGGAAMIQRGLGNGGVAYLCLKSTHRTVDGERRSSIFPYLPRGTQVSLVGPDLLGTRNGARFFLVTEHGVAEINARSQDRFVRALCSVAHPDFRDDLAKAAWEELRVRV
jgi:acyl-CoA hydrolase